MDMINQKTFISLIGDIKVNSYMNDYMT